MAESTQHRDSNIDFIREINANRDSPRPEKSNATTRPLSPLAEDHSKCSVDEVEQEGQDSELHNIPSDRSGGSSFDLDYLGPGFQDEDDAESLGFSFHVGHRLTADKHQIVTPEISPKVCD